ARLREIGDLFRRQLDEVREDRERWRSQAEAVRRLLITDTEHRRPPVDAREDREQWRSQSERRPITGNGQDHRPWWRRIAGRGDVKLITVLGSIWVMVAIIGKQVHRL